MQPITSIRECNVAAKAIGNSDITATVTTGDGFPEGCWIVKDNGNLWLATNSNNQGNGAHPNYHPICIRTGWLHTWLINTVKVTHKNVILLFI